MTSRDLVVSTLNHEPVARVPRDLWTAPEVETTRADELAEVEVRYPTDMIRADFQYPPGKRSKGRPQRAGKFIDAWGCTWRVTERAASCEPLLPPLEKAEQIDKYQPPVEVLEGTKFAPVNRECAATSRFVLGWTDVRPFERLQLLRGCETALADLAHGTTRIRNLLAMLHDFFCREIEIWAESDVDGIVFRDDWGSQQALLIAPEIWRDLFKPLYRDYCKIIHAKDKFALFHSNGDISDIFGDLVKTGVDAIHSELFLMKIEQLAKRFRGKVTFWGELDNQQALPFGSPEEVREAVLRVRKALDFGSGGVIAQLRWGSDVPLKNIMAAFEQWMMPLPMHAA